MSHKVGGFFYLFTGTGLTAHLLFSHDSSCISLRIFLFLGIDRMEPFLLYIGAIIIEITEI